jgi:DNA-binding NtrC family response regulator
LSTITVTVPPLRERQGDVDLLAAHIVGVLQDRFGWRKRIGPAALEVLRRHSWPGNVRELFHVIEAAMVVCDGPEILPEHLPAALRASAQPRRPTAGDDRLSTLEEMERHHIERAIDASHGHRGQAARLLGISERNLYRKLREYGLLQ